MSFDKVMHSMLDSMRIDESFNKLVPSLERLLVHWHDPVRLLLMGEYNVGKSKLINTLLREKVVKSGIVPTTAIATYIRYSEEEYIEVVYENGVVERQTLKKLEQLTSERNIEGKQERKKIHYINLYLPNPFLKKLVLIDTPGLNSPNARHDEQAFDAYDEADDSLWVFQYGNVGKDTEFSVLKKLRDDGLYPIGVVNMIDEATEDDIEPYLNLQFEKLGGRVRKLIGVSALEAEEAYENNDQELLELSLFPQLIDIIEEIKADKESLKKTRFDQSFLKFWIQLNEVVNEILDAERYLKSIQKIRSNLSDVKQENVIIRQRLAEEEIQMKNNNQQILSSFSKSFSLNDWVIRDDFENLIEAIPELKEWKEFNELYSYLLKEIEQLKQDARSYKYDVLKEFGEKIGLSKLLSTHKNVLEKYRFQQIKLLNEEKILNKQIKKINAIHGRLLKEKSFIQDKIVDYYRVLLEENTSSVMKKIEAEKAGLIDVNLKSKNLLQNQIHQWDYLVSLQQQMLQVNQYVQNISINRAIRKELPHLKEERLAEEEITSLNEILKKSSNRKSEKLDFTIKFELPSELKAIEEVPKYFLRNIRPLIGASAIALVASAFILFKEPISNIATAGSEMFSNQEAVVEDDYNGYDYEEANYEATDQSYEPLEYIAGDGREYVGYIDVDSEEIHIYQSSVNGDEETNYVLAPYTSWEVYSETESYYEIQENYWVKKEDASHLFTAYLQEYVQYETAGIATIYPEAPTNNEDILVYERANNESTKIAYLGDKNYEVFAFTENGWLQIGENAWVFYDDQYITLDQWSLNDQLNAYYETVLRNEGTTSSFIPVFAGNSRESDVIGYLENVSDVAIYELPTSKWANIGTNAWIEANKYLDIDWNFVPQVDGEPIGTLTVDVNALNVREMDYQESNLLGILPKGTTVDVYEVSSSTGWYRIGAEGWVSEDPEFSTVNSFYEAYPTGELVIGTVEVLMDVHVRLNDHMKSESQGILKEGTNVDVYEISSETGWYRIGYDAWISNSGKVVTYEDYGVGGY